MINHKDRNNIKTKFGNDWIMDISLWFLLFSNIVTIFIAIIENWDVWNVMWVYWFQSITIGFFNLIWILQLKEFSTEGLMKNGKPVLPTTGTKIEYAFVFLFSYGIFHFFYLMFMTIKIPNSTEFIYIYLTAILFFINHLFSFIYNNSKDTKKQNIGLLVACPYARIIPMHMTIIFGFFCNALLLFLIVKTLADALMHIIEHKVLRRRELQEK